MKLLFHFLLHFFIGWDNKYDILNLIVYSLINKPYILLIDTIETWNGIRVDVHVMYTIRVEQFALNVFRIGQKSQTLIIWNKSKFSYLYNLINISK